MRKLWVDRSGACHGRDVERGLRRCHGLGIHVLVRDHLLVDKRQSRWLRVVHLRELLCLLLTVDHGSLLRVVSLGKHLLPLRAIIGLAHAHGDVVLLLVVDNGAGDCKAVVGSHVRAGRSAVIR